MKIKTPEQFARYFWSTRNNFLGSFTDSSELFYYDHSGSKSNWIIEKVENKDDRQIYSHDKVYIKNEHDKKYVIPAEDDYLTVSAKECMWRIELNK